MKIDTKDRKILYVLDCDARQSSQAIAKKVGLSKDAVNYRIIRLRKEGVIRNFYTILNTLQLGFMHFNTIIKFRNINSQIKNQFVEYYKNHDKVIWCVSFYGSWDYGVSFLAKNVTEYDAFIQDMLNKFGNNIHEKVISMMVDSPTYTRAYLVAGQKGKEFTYKSSQAYSLDETDQKILEIISQRGDFTAIEVADKVNTSPDTIRYRIKQMTKNGIIQGFRISLNPDKIGHLYYKLLFSLAYVTPQKEKELREFCKQEPYIIQYIKYLGNWEVHIELEVPSEGKLFEIIDEIRNRFGVIIKTYDILRLKEEKLDYYPIRSSNINRKRS